MKKILIITVAVILIAIAYYKLAPVWFAKNQQNNTADQTANWKAYTNTQYGFEFKYPQDWKTEPFSNNTCVVIMKTGNTIQICPGLPESITAQDSVDKNVQLLEKTYSDIQNEEKLPINNGIAFYGTSKGIQTDESPSAFLVGSKEVLLMDYTSFNSTLKEAEVIFKEIISTFKFTN